jgi:hypothetical protein
MQVRMPPTYLSGTTSWGTVHSTCLWNMSNFNIGSDLLVVESPRTSGTAAVCSNVHYMRNTATNGVLSQYSLNRL